MESVFIITVPKDPLPECLLCTPHPALNVLQGFSASLNSQECPCDTRCRFLHFIDEETETLQGQVTCLELMQLEGSRTRT